MRPLGQLDDDDPGEDDQATCQLDRRHRLAVDQGHSSCRDERLDAREDPAGRGWFMKIRLTNPSELDGLLTEEQYQEFVKSIS